MPPGEQPLGQRRQNLAEGHQGDPLLVRLPLFDVANVVSEDGDVRQVQRDGNAVQLLRLLRRQGAAALVARRRILHEEGPVRVVRGKAEADDSADAHNGAAHLVRSTGEQAGQEAEQAADEEVLGAPVGRQRGDTRRQLDDGRRSKVQLEPAVVRRQVGEGVHLQHDPSLGRVGRVEVRQVVVDDAKEDTAVQQVQRVLEEQRDGACRGVGQPPVLAGTGDSVAAGRDGLVAGRAAG
mmetsp:Transcript_3199/g.10531  ORF Transcript_3199/g.10531 Transcript_3199/m.10531 type:complete len:237 (-) Transcript_3199:751-1461(-)